MSRPSTASPRRTTLAPLPSAIIAGLVTAATLTTLGAVSVFSMQRIMERAAVREMVSATTAVAFQLSPEVVDAAAAAARGRAPSDTAPAHQLGRLLATLVAALPGVSSYEVAAVHGDSMTVVASQAPAGGPDLPRAPERLGQTLPVASDVRSAWDADSVAIVSRLARSAGVDGIRVWVPVRQPGGRRVIAAVGALAAESRYGRIDQDMRRTIFAGLAISVALSLIAALGRFRAERSRAASDAQLVAAKEAAEATARSRGEFLANMSHEIRTPLHGVLGMTEALLAMPHTEADRRSLAVINRSASSLLGILNDILDYSKLEAGRVDLVNAPFDPRALVDDVTDLFAVRAEEKSLDLAARETARADHWPVGDAARIRQVLLNLVGNAVKFTERGSVQVELSTVAIGRKTIALRIAVRDTGIGIAPEVQERVFEQFSQAEGSTSRRFGGTGLGLTISRQLVLLMGGKISVASVPGEGSEFVVDLQLPASTMSSEPTVLRRFPMGERALVCTDLAGTRAALTELCVRERLAVTTCATTDEARDVLARSPEFAVTFCEMQP
ncbi:MAG TPA: ATP-binding protein, partial [Gemmatimonadaceae bacterium]|nr:ATP-binding protein [Gemmatimonadaceae bacterium]